MNVERAPSSHEIEDRFRQLLENEDLPKPDEVRIDPETGEVLFLWHDRKVAVALDPRSSEDSRIGPSVGVSFERGNDGTA
jgi:hypothetical protein